MEAAEVTPDVYSFSSLASAHAKLADVTAAVKTLSVMSKAGVRPNRFTCSSVMQVGRACSFPPSIVPRDAVHSGSCRSRVRC